MSSSQLPEEEEREPCRYRTLDTIGFGFIIGLLGISAMHLFKGMRLSPEGHGLSEGLQAIRTNGPHTGGRFKLWGGVFSALEYPFCYHRQKNDAKNTIVAGALTGGVSSLRHGLKPFTANAVKGGMVIALPEGSVLLTDILARVLEEKVDKMTAEYKEREEEFIRKYQKTSDLETLNGSTN